MSCPSIINLTLCFKDVILLERNNELNGILAGLFFLKVASSHKLPIGWSKHIVYMSSSSVKTNRRVGHTITQSKVSHC